MIVWREVYLAATTPGVHAALAGITSGRTALRLPALVFVVAIAAVVHVRAEDARLIAPGVADELLGHAVRILPDGKPPQEIGRVVDVLVDTEGHPVAAVLDVGGFMGVGTRKVAVSWPALQFGPGKSGLTITLAMPAEQIRAAPGYVGANRPVQAVGP